LKLALFMQTLGYYKKANSMKKSKIILSSACVALCAGLMSCGSDSPRSVSAADAKIAFNSVNQNLADDIGSMTETAGYSAITSLSLLTNTSNPLGGRMSSAKREEVRDQIKSGLYAFRSILLSAAANGRVNGDTPFNYNEKKGVYEWNSETQVFDYTGESTIVKILFPTVEGSSDNDAEFRLSAYEEQSTPMGDDLYSPTVVLASVLVDGIVEAELDLDVDYGNADQPVLVDINFFVKPFLLELDFNDTGSTTTSFYKTLSTNGETLLGVGLKVTYNNSSKDEEQIKNVNGYVQFLNIRFIANIDASDAANATDINDIVNISIRIDGGNAGRVILEEDPITFEYVPYVRYNDGEVESLQSLFESLQLELENIMSQPG
jgi:hypothetical protein